MISLLSHLFYICQKWMCLTSISRLCLWRKIQRAECMRYIEGKSYSTMTPDRIKKLNDIDFECIPRELRLAHLWNSKSLLIIAMFPPNTLRIHSKYRNTSYLTFMIDHLTSSSHALFRLGNWLHNQRKACKSSRKDSNQ